ncbi:MAG: alpha/beta fold hydrolase [Halioglobus sp.]|nr:alpha/beta fold hydrolase [Halioglobus sp.]
MSELKPPHPLLALTDAPRALLDLAALSAAAPLLRRIPRNSKRRSVMVIPGFLGNDQGNGPLIRFLRSKGYTATGWGQGRNLGVSSFSEDRLRQALEPLIEAGDGQVSLVGHSLGGIYAREIARMEPHFIRQVITLGSPFGRGRQSASHADGLYQRLNPQADERDDENLLATPPPVPTTAIYTRADGVVNWRTSLQSGFDHHVHNIEVAGSHIGMNVNATVWYWIAKKLAG